MTKLYARLGSRSVLWVAPLLGILLTLPSLGGGWVLDDHFHRQVFLGSDRLEGILGSRLDIFRFFDGNPERTQRMMDLGIVPWWTVPDLRGAFWRPVTALTHWLDYALWPAHSALMHLHSIAWYGLLIFAVASLYRRLLGFTPVAGLAALLYAIDDGHGMPVGFLANRNAVIAVVFGVLTLLLHDRWRRRDHRSCQFLAPLAFAASLLSSEAGLGTTAYLFAYALFLDRGPLQIRALSLLPYGLLVLAWRWAWTAQGYGVSDGLSFYIDPLHSPIEYLLASLQRLPILLLGQWAIPPSDVVLLISPAATRILAAIAAAVLVVLCSIVGPVLWNYAAPERSNAPPKDDSFLPAHLSQPFPRRRIVYFAVVGMLLALLPCCATFPSDRLLLFVGLGGTMLVGIFLTTVFKPPLPLGSDEPTGEGGSEDRGEGRPLRAWRNPRRAWALSLAYALVVIHALIAPIGLFLRAKDPVGPPALHHLLYVRTPLDQTVTDQTVVIVNPPSVIHACYLPALREAEGEPVPRRVRALAPGLPSVTVRRLDTHTLAVRPERGYLVLFFDRLFRNELQPLHLGQRIAMEGMTVEVTELTPDGRPAEATFRFETPLEDHSLLWLEWTEGRFRPWSPPPIGATVELRPDPTGVEWLR